MTPKSNSWIVAVVVLILTAAIFYFGYVMRGVWNSSTVTQIDTIYRVDTIEHHIISKIPYYISKTDTVIKRDTVFKDIDTSAILVNYFAWHTYERVWNDSTVKITLRDVISENKVYDSDLDYKILRPQVLITEVKNEYNYSKYLYAGGSVSLKDAELGLFYASRRVLIGLQYNPFIQSPTVSIGLGIAKFK